MNRTVRRLSTIPLTLFALASNACSSDVTGGVQGSTATLTVVNNSPNTVIFLRTRSCGTTTWGSDLLGSGVLGHGETLSHTFAPGCVDVRLTPAETGKDYLYFYGVQLDGGSTKSLNVTAFPAD